LTATDRPIFRTDLVSRPIESAGHRFIEVTDPDSGHSFRFYEVEYAIACAMDGERDLHSLADWAKIELGLDPSPEELRTVIGTLEDLGYLDSGMPGAAAAAQPAPLDRPPPAGRPLPPDLSTDLSDHIPVRAADVKEAVRQSRAMQAMRPPQESFNDDGFEDEQTPAPTRPGARPAAAAAAAGTDGGSRPAPAPAVSPELSKTLLGTPPPVVQPGRQAVRTPTPPPMVLPESPAEISKPAAPTLAPSRPIQQPSRPMATAREPARETGAGQPVLPARRSAGLLPYLIVLLLLSAAGAGVYWWFFLRPGGPGTQDENGPPPAAPSTVEPNPSSPPAAAEPPPPAEIVATLEAGPTQEQNVTAPRLGQVVWLAAAGSEVSEGAPVGKFDGYQRWDYAVKEAQESQRRYQEKLDQATAKGDKDAMKEAEANVRRKQGDIDRNVAELDKFLIKAPIGGLVEPAIKQRAQAKKDEVVAKILAQSEPRATFVLPAGAAHIGATARVVARSDAGLAATCKVLESAPGKLVVACPTDSGLASGAEVVLKSEK
jgi:hypothetical protein